MNRALTVLVVGALLASVSPIVGQQSASPQTVAEVNGERITLEAVTQASGQPLASLEEQAYALKQQKLQQLIADRLLAGEARRRNTSVEALTTAEITSKVAAVTAEEIHSLYEGNKGQLQRPETDVQDLLTNFIREQKIAARRAEYVTSLQSQATIKVFLTPPVPFRADVAAVGPSRGAADAPVTIVVFEDFHCPYCKQVHDTLERVLTRYQTAVRVVHRDFPLQALHPESWRAHEAARCADSQDKFWEYRALLYANAPAATAEQLGAYATRTGMDVAAFKKCLDGGAFRAAITKDEQEGERVGVTGTPAFFINGRLLSGSQPEGAFARIIDEELTRKAER